MQTNRYIDVLYLSKIGFSDVTAAAGLRHCTAVKKTQEAYEH